MIYRNASSVPIEMDSENDENDSILNFLNNNSTLSSESTSSAVTSSSTSPLRSTYYNYLNDDLRKRIEDYMNIINTPRPVDVDEFMTLLGDIMRTLPLAKQLELENQIVELLLEYGEKNINRNLPEE